MKPTLYDRDYYLWLETTAKQLDEAKWQEVEETLNIEYLPRSNDPDAV